MILQFSSVVRDIDQHKSIICISRVAGIDAIQIRDGTRVANSNGASVTWTTLQPGMRVRVSGIDEGGNSLAAQELVITGERVEPRIEDSNRRGAEKEKHAYRWPGIASRLRGTVV